jgi:hypothetical protein
VGRSGGAQVLEALITFEKIDVLIYDLVLIEAWREGVFPLLFDELAGDARRSSAMRCYFVLYHEATVVNLLEVVCYHAHALAAAKDATLDLLDYCARRLAALHAKADERVCCAGPSSRRGGAPRRGRGAPRRPMTAAA